jgi:hypothetical protein
LIVELNVVEIDKITNLGMNSGIGTIWIALLTKIRSLWSMSDDVPRQHASQLFGKRYKPSLAFAIIHSSVVLIINIGSIKMIVHHKIAQTGGAGNWILVGWKCCGSKSTNQYKLASIIIFCS